MRNKIVGAVVAVLAVAAFGVGSATAMDIPGGIINSTVIIYDNSRLTGDVDCSRLPDGAQCIVFGADNIKLDLNGHIMTGKSDRGDCSTSTGGEIAIFAEKNGVVVKGPGLIRRFRFHGIEVIGNNSKVERVTVLDSCADGIQLAGSDNVLEENTVVRSALSADTDNIGIEVAKGKKNVVRRNEVIGAGGPRGGNGIRLFCTADSLIEENNVSGNNGHGIIILDLSPQDCLATASPVLTTTGNITRHNIAFGNSTNDIQSLNPSGANTYQENACEVSTGPDAAGACPKVTKNAGHENPPTDE